MRLCVVSTVYIETYGRYMCMCVHMCSSLVVVVVVVGGGCGIRTCCSSKDKTGQSAN